MCDTGAFKSIRNEHGFRNKIYNLEQLKELQLVLLIIKIELLECEIFQYSSTFPL